MSKISDAQIIELFRKYETQTIDEVRKVATERGYAEREVNEFAIWDAALHQTSNHASVSALVNSIEKSGEMDYCGFPY